MKAWILPIGAEVLSGMTIDSNSHYLANQLFNLGIACTRIVSIEDDVCVISREVTAFLASDAELLITTGGLGPTLDDCTKQGVAQALRRPLVFSSQADADIKQYLGTTYGASQARQAEIIEGSIPLSNPTGTADGFLIEIPKKMIILLPGPPGEMQYLAETYVWNYLKDKTRDFYVSSYLTQGIPEAQLAADLEQLFANHDTLQVMTYASDGIVTCLFKSKGEQVVKQATQLFEQTFTNAIISKDNRNLVELVVEQLRNHKLTVSFAESVTGEALVSQLITVPHASEIISESFVTYSETAKHNILGVASATIAKYGVVSPEVALAMVEGLKKLSRANLLVSVTGYAGPDGDVGEVYFAISNRDQTVVCERMYRGSRKMIIKRISNDIYSQLLRLIKHGIDAVMKKQVLF